MALIACPECGRQVSDRAPACPGCGYPIARGKAPPPPPPPPAQASHTHVSHQQTGTFGSSFGSVMGTGCGCVVFIGIIFAAIIVLAIAAHENNKNQGAPRRTSIEPEEARPLVESRLAAAFGG